MLKGKEKKHAAVEALDASGKIATNYNGTQVLFDGQPAPIIYASATQVNVIVPYEVNGRTSTKIEVA